MLLQHNKGFYHLRKPVISKIFTTFLVNTIFLNDETFLAKHPFILKGAKDQRSTALSPFLYSCGFYRHVPGIHLKDCSSSCPVLGHSIKGMNAHYLVPTDESLTRAMDKYTRWFDREVFSANVDQSVDHGQSSGR
jgi:hypothetical protein